jgi:hypothetical protein
MPLGTTLARVTLSADLSHCGFFCKLCWHNAVTNRGRKAIIRQVTAIQRWFRYPLITQRRLYAESGDGTDSDTGVEYYFRPELIGHYVSNYPIYISLLPAAARQDQDPGNQPCDHPCLLCQQAMALEQCPSHSEQLKSFCDQC